MAQPTFAPEVEAAFKQMNSLGATSDFLVTGFRSGTTVMELVEAGMGGMARVVQILSEQFQDKIGVAVFRVTAVDDRGVTVSYRTKIIHVIYSGPGAPRMQRAKVASSVGALKGSFSANMGIQTDDVTDLDPAAIEKSLRAAGGAHQPTSFDFANTPPPPPSS